MKLKRTIFIEKGQLDIAPLIDIIFLLLIFFMLTSSFIFQPGIRVNLPKAVTSEALHRDILIVVITKENKIYINERTVSESELEPRIIAAARGGQSLLIKADRDASLGKVIAVWDACRHADIKQVNIATNQQ